MKIYCRKAAVGEIAETELQEHIFEVAESIPIDALIGRDIITKLKLVLDIDGRQYWSKTNQ